MIMPNQIVVLWTYLRTRAGQFGERDERGSVVETVIITALFAALAITICAIIVTKVTAKTNSINLN
jgi:hypothetical protein